MDSLPAVRDGAATSEKDSEGVGLFTRLVVKLLVMAQMGLPQSKPKRSKKNRPPSRGIDGCFNYGADGYTWAWFKIPTVGAWDFLNKDQRQIKQDELMLALNALAGRHIHLAVEAVDIDLDAIEEQWERGLIPEATTAIRENHKKFRRSIREALRHQRYKQRQVYIGVRLQETRSLLQLMVAKLKLWLGTSEEEARGNAGVRFQDQVQELQGIFQAHGMDLDPLTQAELLRLIRRNIFRGHRDTEGVGFDQEKPIFSDTELARLGSSRARDHHDHLTINYQGYDSYVTYLAVASLPEQEVAASWLFLSDQIGAPINASVRMFVETPEKIEREAGSTLSVLKQTRKELRKEQRKGKNLEEELARIEIEIDKATQVKLQAHNREYAVRAQALFMVAAATESQLQQAQTYLIQSCKRRSIALEIDQAHQAEMRRHTYPGSERLYTDYTLSLFCSDAAASTPHATSAFGNGGHWHGQVRGRERYPFLYSHSRVLDPDVDTSTGQVFVGPPGEGKTDAMLERGAADAKDGFAVLYDEGKGDTERMRDRKLPFVKTRLLALAEFPGLLNPLFLGEDLKECRTLTLETLTLFIQSEMDKNWKGLLNQVIGDELTEFPKTPILERIIRERLMQAPADDPESKTKRRIGLALASALDIPHADVIFSTENHWQNVASEYLQPGQMTFVLYNKLSLPDAEKAQERYTDSERLAVVIRNLTNLLYSRIAKDPSVPLSIYKDEIHIDKRLQGSSFVDFMARIGRSKQTLISLGGQTLSDIPLEFRKYCSTYNIFRLGTPEEAREAINILGLEAKQGSAYEKGLIRLLMAKDKRKRRRFDVVVKIHTGEVGLVAFQQIHLQGEFASNRRAVLEHDQQQLSQNGETGAIAEIAATTET